MYHSYFGLDEQAFSIAVNPRYLYMSTQHREALAHLLYGVSSGGFVMLTGEVGTGKTTIIRALFEQLPGNADLAVVMNPSASARDLLCSICDEFRIEYPSGETSLKVLTDALFKFLVENHQRGRKTIVLIDEAQLLRVSTLEQVRLLTNLETNTQKLLQIILVGQPELNELLAKPALRQLSQRITARYHLRPLKEQEVEAYIKHRLRVAGMPPGRTPFPPAIVKKVHQISKGIPRVINVLCDRMLLGAYSREATQVDAGIYRQATIEVLGESVQRPLPRLKGLNLPRPWLYGAAGALGLLLVSTVLWLAFDDEDSSAPQQVIARGEILRSETAAVANAVAATTPAAPVTLAPAGTNPSYWLRNHDQAMSELLGVVGLDHEGAIYPCWAASEQGFRCETQKVSTWEEFRAVDRPAVLTITTPARQTAYVPVAAIDEETAWVRVNGEIRPIPLAQLGRLWTGEFEFVWRRPDAFREAVGLGSRGPFIAWLANQFAQLDGQSAPLAREHFNAQLQTRVKLFQRSQNLADDGLVGMQTLLKLNEALGLETSMTQVLAGLTEANSEG